MINRRTFLSLLPMVPPVCKALVAQNAEWDQFAAELSRALSSLHANQFLIIEIKSSLYYVQFAGEGSSMRAEAVSNGYLDTWSKLSDRACAKLLQLGWNPPTFIPDRINNVLGHKGSGSPNYFLKVDVPVPYHSVANLAVNSLRQVFRAMHLRQLRYKAFAKPGGIIEFPKLGIASVESA